MRKRNTPISIKIDRADRTWMHIILNINYKIIKDVNTSLWFYFAPIYTLYISYFLPYYLGSENCINEWCEIYRPYKR